MIFNDFDWKISMENMNYFIELIGVWRLIQSLENQIHLVQLDSLVHKLVQLRGQLSFGQTAVLSSRPDPFHHIAVPKYQSLLSKFCI